MPRPINLAPVQISLTINNRQQAKLQELAKKAGLPFAVYCQNIFDAAYAAKVGVCQDEDFDAKVRVALTLFGAGSSEESIAKTLGVSKVTVIRIVDATRREIKSRHAA